MRSCRPIASVLHIQVQQRETGLEATATPAGHRTAPSPSFFNFGSVLAIALADETAIWTATYISVGMEGRRVESSCIPFTLCLALVRECLHLDTSTTTSFLTIAAILVHSGSHQRRTRSLIQTTPSNNSSRSAYSRITRATMASSTNEIGGVRKRASWVC
jgi:hypothetical protein